MSAADQIWHMAVLWHGLDLLPRLRRLAPEELKQVLKEAGEWSEKEPLHLHPERDLSVPSFDSRTLSGGQVYALMLFGLWVLVGEREEAAPHLVRDWPELKVVSSLCSKMEEVATI